MHQACSNSRSDVKTTVELPASPWAQVLTNGPKTRRGSGADHADAVCPSAPRDQSQERHAEKPPPANFTGHSKTGMAREAFGEQPRGEKHPRMWTRPAERAATDTPCRGRR